MKDSESYRRRWIIQDKNIYLPRNLQEHILELALEVLNMGCLMFI